MIRTTLLATIAALIVSASATAGVPTTIGFTARVVDDKTGKALTGTHRISFELFDAEAAGHSVWQEGRDVPIDDGLVFTDIGQNRPLDATVFDGKKLWLEVKLDDIAMEPRVVLDSVPYAIHASDTDSLAGMGPEDLQARITGTCTVGSFVSAINADGTVVCTMGAAGTGDITGVSAGGGLMGGGLAGDVTLGLINTCAATQILKWSGSAWACAADASNTGDITGVLIGAAGGLTGGGTSGDVTISLLGTCAPGQLLKWNGATWICGNDIDTDTNSGGDITGVLITGTGGLVGGGTSGDVALSLLNNCAAGQLLKWNGAAWGCANDIDTNGGGTLTGVTAGNGLTGGGAAGAVTLDVGAGAGLTVAADQIALDTAFTDARYVKKTGDSMAGALNMAGFQLTGRGCKGGYTAVGTGLCVEDPDASAFTFSACANRCRAAGTHMCSSGEMRAVMSSGVTLTITTTLDWLDDQDANDNALYVDNGGDPANPDGTRLTTTASYCRCCQNIE